MLRSFNLGVDYYVASLLQNMFNEYTIKHFDYGKLWRGVGNRRHIGVTSGDRVAFACLSY